MLHRPKIALILFKILKVNIFSLCKIFGTLFNLNRALDRFLNSTYAQNKFFFKAIWFVQVMHKARNGTVFIIPAHFEIFFVDISVFRKIYRKKNFEIIELGFEKFRNKKKIFRYRYFEISKFRNDKFRNNIRHNISKFF